MPKSSSQDVQSVPAGVQCLLLAHPTTSSPKKLSAKSIGRGIEEYLAIKFQVYRHRQRSTHVKASKRIGPKDEKEQRRDCKAEYPAQTVAAAALLM